MNIGKEYLEVDIEQIQIINKLRNLPKIDTCEAIINGRTYPTHTIVNGVVLSEGEMCYATTNIKSVATHLTLTKVGELLNEKNVVAIRVYPEISTNGKFYQCHCRLAYADKEEPTAEAFRNGIDNCKLCEATSRTNKTFNTILDEVKNESRLRSEKIDKQDRRILELEVMVVNLLKSSPIPKTEYFDRGMNEHEYIAEYERIKKLNNSMAIELMEYHRTAEYRCTLLSWEVNPERMGR